MRAMRRVVLKSWLVAAAMVACMLPAAAGAVIPVGGSGGGGGGGGSNNNPATSSNTSGGTSLTKPDGSCVQIALPIFGNNTCVQNDKGNGGAIVVYLRDVLKLLSGLVGITIIIMIIWAGIQYITSAGDPSGTKDAKNRLVNALTALLLFLMMFAILQFLVPGGIL